MSTWEKTWHGGKAAFDKGWALFEKLGAPVNRLTNKIGSEAFWPSSMDRECDKCARILQSFCKYGFYKEQPISHSSSAGPKHKPKVLVKIPPQVIQNCVGLAIFSVMRAGLWVSGAGGSGVLIARKEDGSWSPPSGILVHTLGVGFMAGVDIYDCVLVINNREALDAFSKLRVSIGGEVSVVAGPLGAGGVTDLELIKNRRPTFSYMKSRGLYGGVQLDGTIIIERTDSNADFYWEKVGVKQILAGHVRRIPPETRMLMEVLKEADGRIDLDYGLLGTVHGPAPGDCDIEMMNEPTAEQKVHYAPPPGYYAQSSQHAYQQQPQGYYPPASEGAYQQPQDPYAAGEASQPYYPEQNAGQQYPPAPPQQGAAQVPYHPPPPSHTPGAPYEPYYPPPPGPPPTAPQTASYPPDSQDSNPKAPTKAPDSPPPLPPRH